MSLFFMTGSWSHIIAYNGRNTTRIFLYIVALKCRCILLPLWLKFGKSWGELILLVVVFLSCKRWIFFFYVLCKIAKNLRLDWELPSQRWLLRPKTCGGFFFPGLPPIYLHPLPCQLWAASLSPLKKSISLREAATTMFHILVWSERRLQTATAIRSPFLFFSPQQLKFCHSFIDWWSAWFFFSHNRFSDLRYRSLQFQNYHGPLGCFCNYFSS